SDPSGRGSNPPGSFRNLVLQLRNRLHGYYHFVIDQRMPEWFGGQSQFRAPKPQSARSRESKAHFSKPSRPRYCSAPGSKDSHPKLRLIVARLEASRSRLGDVTGSAKSYERLVS